MRKADGVHQLVHSSNDVVRAAASLVPRSQDDGVGSVTWALVPDYENYSDNYNDLVPDSDRTMIITRTLVPSLH